MTASTAFDARANGEERAAPLGAMAALSRGVIAESGGRLIGFGLVRAFGRGHLIGPLEAESPAVAAALLARLMATQPPGFLRIDLLHDEPAPPPAALTTLLDTAGLVRDERATIMTLGATPPVIFGAPGLVPEQPKMFSMMTQSLC